MTTEDQMTVDTAISRAGRRIYENIGYVAFLAITVGPIVAGFCDAELAKRAVELQGPVLAAQTALGIFIGWMKTLGHRENMQQMKGGT